jgi:hypothetical protein
MFRPDWPSSGVQVAVIQGSAAHSYNDVAHGWDKNNIKNKVTIMFET